jgi:hypothetical protein
MPTVYSAPSSKWPLLQSKTEQKFKSGLLNVSAEFIRPVGNTTLPSVIETSIGAVDVWPEPTVSVGTDGFERINATGYGVWAAAPSISFGIINSHLNFFANITTSRFYDDPSACSRSYSLKQYQLPASAEYCVITYVSDLDAPIPFTPLPRELKIFDETGGEIQTSSFDFSKPWPPMNPEHFNFPNTTEQALIYKQIGREMSVENIANLKIVTLVYTIFAASFYFSFTEPDPPECTGFV